MFDQFNGVSGHAWQLDMLDTVFDELNPFDDDTPDLNVRAAPHTPAFLPVLTDCA